MAPVSDDLHERFMGWLLAGAEGDPPRDVAIHAALCAECERWIAAHDALNGIDPGRAPLPPSRAVPEAALGGWRSAGRVAAATGSLLVLGAVAALGVSRYLGDLPESPAQQVLAVTGSPEPTPRAPAPVGGEVSGSHPSPAPSGGQPSIASTRPPLRPAHVPTPPVPSLAAIASATAIPSSATPRPQSQTSAPTASPSPTATPTLPETPSPTPSPIPGPSASG